VYFITSNFFSMDSLLDYRTVVALNKIGVALLERRGHRVTMTTVVGDVAVQHSFTRCDGQTATSSNVFHFRAGNIGWASDVVIVQHGRESMASQIRRSQQMRHRQVYVNVNGRCFLYQVVKLQRHEVAWTRAKGSSEEESPLQVRRCK
jgi:hypothetical protein